MRRTLSIASCAAAILAWSTSPADAQKQVFVEGLAELTAASAGTFGDEGPRVGPALDTMARGLAEWDRVIRAFESKLASELPAAPPPVAAQMRATLGGMYVERGRYPDALRELEVASQLEPQRADLHLLRARLLDASARPADAREAFRAAWAVDSANPIAAYYFLHHSSGPPEGGPYVAAAASGAARTRRVHVRPCRRRIAGLSRSARARRLPRSPVSVFFKRPPRRNSSYRSLRTREATRSSRAASTTRRSPNSERPPRSIRC